MNEKFSTKKFKILEQLSKDDEEYADASPKGSVDEGIRDLVQTINSTSGYVTTSSCAGRIALFLEGAVKTPASPLEVGLNETSLESRHVNTASAGGKGGGRWLFVSHEPVAVGCLSRSGAVFELLGLPADSSISTPELEEAPQYVHLKFEPMILHILTAGVEQAQTALAAAMTAGFRESGISGVVGSRGGSATPMVAVRSSGLAFDSIIGFKHATDDASIRLMVSESYLRTLIQVAEQRFRVNAERKDRFRRAFLQKAEGEGMSPPKLSVADSQDYEPADVRRDRKRREGLERKAEMSGSNPVSECHPWRDVANDDYIRVDLLMDEAEQS